MSDPPALGVFGGRFDPFHLAHLQVCEAACVMLPIDRLIVIPSGSPVHKDVVAPWPVRLEMAQDAIAGLAGVQVARLEPEEVQGYFFDTLSRLPGPAGAVVAILGSDAFSQIASWGRWQELLAQINWAVITRKSHPSWEPVDEKAREIALENQVASAQDLASGAGRVWLWKMDLPDLSAQQLRKLVSDKDESWRKKVPQGVARLIDSHGLYRS